MDQIECQKYNMKVPIWIRKLVKKRESPEPKHQDNGNHNNGGGGGGYGGGGGDRGYSGGGGGGGTWIYHESDFNKSSPHLKKIFKKMFWYS